MERLAADPPRPDRFSRTTLGGNKVVLVDLAAAGALELAKGFDPGDEIGSFYLGVEGANRVGRAVLYGAVAAEEVVHWLTAGLRALERAGAAAKTATAPMGGLPPSPVGDLRRIEAAHYLHGAGRWLRVTHVAPLADWAANNPPALEEARQRVLRWNGNGVPLRDLVRDNLRGHRIAPLDATAVASVFTRRSAAEVAETFDPLKSASVLRAANNKLARLGHKLDGVGGPLLQLARPE